MDPERRWPFNCNKCLPGADMRPWVDFLSRLNKTDSDSVLESIYTVARIPREYLVRSIDTCRALSGPMPMVDVYGQEHISAPTFYPSNFDGAPFHPYSLTQDQSNAFDAQIYDAHNGEQVGNRATLRDSPVQMHPAPTPPNFTRRQQVASLQQRVSGPQQFNTQQDSQDFVTPFPTVLQPVSNPNNSRHGSSSVLSDPSRSPSLQPQSKKRKRLSKSRETAKKYKYNCPDCGKGYDRQSNLEQHLVSRHYNSRHELAEQLGIVPKQPAMQSYGPKVEQL